MSKRIITKTIITLAASAALCLAILPGPASARGGGGHGGGGGMHGGGMGMHGGGMGMHGGGMGMHGGWGMRGGMGGGWRGAPVAFHAGRIGNGVAFHHRAFIHDRFAFRHHRFRFFPGFYVASYIDDGCYFARRVWTPWGWHWRRVWVCG